MDTNYMRILNIMYVLSKTKLMNSKDEWFLFKAGMINRVGPELIKSSNNGSHNG